MIMENKSSLGKGALNYELTAFCAHLLYLYTNFHLQSSKDLTLITGVLMKFPCEANGVGIVISYSQMGKQCRGEVWHRWEGGLGSPPPTLALNPRGPIISVAVVTMIKTDFLFCTRHCPLTTLQAFPYLILTTLAGWYNYYSYLTDDKTEAQKCYLPGALG